MGDQSKGTSLRPVTPIGLIAAELDRLVADPTVEGLSAEGRARLERAQALAAGLEPYLTTAASPESAGLGSLADRTVEAEWGDGLEAEMLSGHVEGQFLKMLVRLSSARSILEIGLFTGYSALAMAEALPGDGVLVACELDPGAAAFARRALDAAPGGERVEIRVGAAADTLRQLATEGVVFDMVFIDADKAGYTGYLRQVLDSGLLATGGLICVDNTLLQGEPYLSPEHRSSNGEAIAAFNQVVSDDPRLEQVLIPLRDGVTLIQRIDEG